MAVTPEDFVRIMGAFPTGVAIVTATDSDGTPRGLTTNAVTSVSLRPPILLVCVDLTSRTLGAIRRSGRFAVNFIRADCEHLCRLFASKADDKFEHVAWARGPAGAPLLHDHAVAYAECSLVHDVELGDHAVLAGLVSGGSQPDAGSDPIVYFRRSFHRAPAEA